VATGSLAPSEPACAIKSQRASVEGWNEVARPQVPAPPGRSEAPPHVLLLVAALAAGATAQGAYGAAGQAIVALFLVAALLAAVRAHRWAAEEVRLVPLPAGAALAGWALVSAALAGRPLAAAAPVGLLGGMAAVLITVRRASSAEREVLVGAVLAVGVLTALSGWTGVAWRVAPWGMADQGLWRAATTLTYANAAAGLLVPLALLGLARLAERPHAPLAAPATCMLLAGSGATLSRGGAVALVAGLAVLLWRLGPLRVLAAVAAPALGAAVALAGLVPSLPAARPAHPLPALAALATGLALAAALPRLPSRTSRWVIALAVAGLVVATVVLAHGGALHQLGHSRLTAASPDRVAAARAALRLAAQHPLTGVGPGLAVLTWVGPDGSALLVHYAHNEYLQTLAELGGVGLLLLAWLLAAVARAIWRGRLALPAAPVWAGAAAGLVALAVHSTLDFLWHLPAIPLAAAVLGGLAIPSPAAPLLGPGTGTNRPPPPPSGAS
jgi:O-Antigen ligase